MPDLPEGNIHWIEALSDGWGVEVSKVMRSWGKETTAFVANLNGNEATVFWHGFEAAEAQHALLAHAVEAPPVDYLLPEVDYVLDTALSPDHTPSEIGPGDIIVGYVGGNPAPVAVIGSYTKPDAYDAWNIAVDYLRERGVPVPPLWPDYIVQIPAKD